MRVQGNLFRFCSIFNYIYLRQSTSVQIKTDDFTPYFATKDHHQGYGYQI